MRVKFVKVYESVDGGEEGRMVPSNLAGCVEVVLDTIHPELGYWGNTVCLDAADVDRYLIHMGSYHLRAVAS